MPAHLVDLGVEIVHGREQEGFDRHRLDRRSVFERAVMRQDQVLEFRHELGGHARLIAHRVAQHADAQHDVADEIAFDRVVRGRFVRQFLQLADVVQERAGNQQVAAGAVLIGQEQRDRS